MYCQNKHTKKHTRTVLQCYSSNFNHPNPDFTFIFIYIIIYINIILISAHLTLSFLTVAL